MTVLFPLSEDGSHKRLFQGDNKESSRVFLLSGEIQPLPKEPPLHTLEKIQTNMLMPWPREFAALRCRVLSLPIAPPVAQSLCSPFVP